jgi:quercetin dioxygenase-like cupin family protein
MSDIHADRRSPSAPDGPLDLEAAGADLLKEARGVSSGRAAKSLTPGAHAPLKQTLVALRAGVELDEHTVNGPATIQLLRGSATIGSAEGVVELRSGQWAPIPAARHNLVAGEDVVALLTVAPTAEPAPRDDD